MANFQKLQLSLILRVAVQICQILQIPAVICRILQIPPNSANSALKFLSKKPAKISSQKILQFTPKGIPNISAKKDLLSPGQGKSSSKDDQMFKNGQNLDNDENVDTERNESNSGVFAVLAEVNKLVND